MNGRFIRFILLVASIFITGCAFVNVQFFRPMEALQEKVLEGEGNRKILLMNINGFISESEKSKGIRLGEETSDIARVREELQKAEKDEDVIGVVIRINSPGGTITATDIIHHELMEFKRRTGKPVVAHIMSVGASGGYYIATAADTIIASPTAITGSIGVIAMKFDIHELLHKIGVSSDAIKSGDKKDLGSPFRPTTREEREILQNIINQMHRRFVDVVAQGRRKVLSETDVLELADGRVYAAPQALQARLIDRIGYLDEVISSLKKSLSVSTARVITYVRPNTYRGTIYSGAPAFSPQVLNLINVDGYGLSQLPEVQFLYLWRQ
jgi:protease IV